MAKRAKLIDLTVAFLGVGLYFSLQYVMQEERAFTIALVMYVFYVVVSDRWKQRYERWFQVSVAALAILHFAVLTYLSFPEYGGPSIISVPFAIADGFFIWTILNWIEKRSVRK